MPGAAAGPGAGPDRQVVILLPPRPSPAKRDAASRRDLLLRPVAIPICWRGGRGLAETGTTARATAHKALHIRAAVTAGKDKGARMLSGGRGRGRRGSVRSGGQGHRGAGRRGGGGPGAVFRRVGGGAVAAGAGRADQSPAVHGRTTQGPPAEGPVATRAVATAAATSRPAKAVTRPAGTTAGGLHRRHGRQRPE